MNLLDDIRSLDSVASRELRNETRKILERVRAGESLTVTVDGIAVAVIRPLETRPSSIPKQEFIERLLTQQADPGLTAELAELVGESTDDDLRWFL